MEATDMKRASLIGAFGAMMAIATSVKAEIPDPVKIDTGQLSGASTGTASVRVFKGIPFAAPPTGENRWRAPQPAAKWEGVRKADAFAAPCLANAGAGRGGFGGGGGRGGGRPGGAPGAAPGAAPGGGAPGGGFGGRRGAAPGGDAAPAAAAPGAPAAPAAAPAAAAAPAPAAAPAAPRAPAAAEDCLYVNVWTSAARASDKKPVMVFIYGGGFFS